MKKVITILLTFIIIFSFSACNQSQINGKSTQELSIEVQKNILDSIPDELSIYLSDDKDDIVTVAPVGKKLLIYINTKYTYYIPIVAEIVCPIIQQILNDNELELHKLSIRCQVDNETIGSWSTTNYTDGDLLITFSNSDEVEYKNNYTINDLFSYYSKYLSNYERTTAYTK